jgi:hypothetical protein
VDENEIVAETKSDFKRNIFIGLNNIEFDESYCKINQVCLIVNKKETILGIGYSPNL